jgi:hypothetical protein
MLGISGSCSIQHNDHGRGNAHIGIPVHSTVSGKQFASLHAAHPGDVGIKHGKAQRLNVQSPMFAQHVEQSRERPVSLVMHSIAHSAPPTTHRIRQDWISDCNLCSGNHGACELIRFVASKAEGVDVQREARGLCANAQQARATGPEGMGGKMAHGGLSATITYVLCRARNVDMSVGPPQNTATSV